MAFMGALRKLGLAGGQRRLLLFLFLSTAHGAATFLAGMWLERVLAGTRLRVGQRDRRAHRAAHRGGAGVARLLRPCRVKLMYFNIDGLGEPIWLALAQAGVPFDDHRFKEGEFATIKPTLAFGQVPCLVVDGREIVQTASILRYVGKVLDATGTLYPADAAVAQRVDAMMDQTKDMMTGRMAHKYRERFGFGCSTTRRSPRSRRRGSRRRCRATSPSSRRRSPKAAPAGSSGAAADGRRLPRRLPPAFEKTCADKVTMPAALAAYTEALRCPRWRSSRRARRRRRSAIKSAAAFHSAAFHTSRATRRRPRRRRADGRRDGNVRRHDALPRLLDRRGDRGDCDAADRRRKGAAAGAGVGGRRAAVHGAG